MKFPVKWVFPMLCIHCHKWVVTEYIHYVGTVPGECYLSQFWLSFSLNNLGCFQVWHYVCLVNNSSQQGRKEICHLEQRLNPRPYQSVACYKQHTLWPLVSSIWPLLFMKVKSSLWLWKHGRLACIHSWSVCACLAVMCRKWTAHSRGP